MPIDLIALADAFDNPDLFGPHFAHASWTAWRAFVRVLLAAPLSAEQAATYCKHTGRTALPAEAFEEAALIVGRRGGKSRVLAFLATAMATLRDYEPYLVAGELATVMVIAQTQRQARTIFRYVGGFLRAIPDLAAMVETETAEQIVLNNRVVIEIASASFRSTRGYTLACVLADEIAFWRSEESQNPDVEILRALRPALATIPGAQMLLASSPYGKKGALYQAYKDHYGKDASPVLVWKAGTLDMHPSKRLERERARDFETDPEAAKAEWDGEFRDDLADFISRDTIDAVTMIGRSELPVMAGVHYGAFADPSGGANDSFCLAIGHQQGDVGVLDCLVEIRPPFDPDQAVQQCAEVLKRYNISRVVGDHYAGLWPVARFSAHGITFEQSARAKSDIYRDFLPLASARRIELLDHRRMASQFVGLERRVGRSGKDSIAEPTGAHDDCCNVVAGLLVGLDLDRRPTLIRRSDMIGEQPAVAIAPRLIGASVWVSLDGMAGWCITASQTFREPLRMVIEDADLEPWRSDLLTDIAAEMNEIAEAVRARWPHVFVNVGLCVPEQLLPMAGRAMDEAFRYSYTRPDIKFRLIASHHIDVRLLDDPAGLLLGAVTHVGAGEVKFGKLAVERAAGRPLLGALTVRAGEDVLADPLRVAILLEIRDLDGSAQDLTGASVRFG